LLYKDIGIHRTLGYGSINLVVHRGTPNFIGTFTKTIVPQETLGAPLVRT